MAHIPLPPSGLRSRLQNACLSYQPGPVPHFANVSAVRARDLDALADVAVQASRWFEALHRRDFVWFLGSRTRPVGARDFLLARGAVPMPRQTALVMGDEAPPAVDGIDVHEVDSAEELQVFRELVSLAGGFDDVSDAMRAALASTNDGAWSDLQAMAGRRRLYLAFIDDRPVAAGGIVFPGGDTAVLSGGATLGDARGRGCYRALLHTRWQAARSVGVQHLVVGASDYSRPILMRLGFDEVGEIITLRQTVD